MSPITPELLASAMTYSQYVTLSTDLLADGRTTSDDPHYNTPEILGYAKLNLQRMRRLDKTIALQPAVVQALARIAQPIIWLVLTESWCGDAAQLVPLFNRMAEQSEHITLRFILRDKNPDVMEAYLTNGGRSIPKLIGFRSSDWQELGTWGPRPQPLQQLMDEWKAQQIPWQESLEAVQRWYNTDQTVSAQLELLPLLASLTQNT